MMEVGEIGFVIKKADGTYLQEEFSTRPQAPFMTHRQALRRLRGALAWNSRPEAPIWRSSPITDGKIVMVKLVEVDSI